MSARLTPEQRRDREVSENSLHLQIVDLAGLFGWSWAHFRPAQTQKGWRTPVSGTLGAGFPDLVLAHPAQRRVIFVELKRETGTLSAEQEMVHATLRLAGAEVYVWRPSDLERAVDVLQRPGPIYANLPDGTPVRLEPVR